MSSTVVLVDDDKMRAEALARYLEEVGFSVRLVEDPAPDCAGADAMVWMAGNQLADRAIVDSVRSWLGARCDARAVIVCERPAQLAGVIEDARVWLLPTPIHGWRLVKALRDASPLFSPRSRSLHRRRRRRPRL